MTGPPANPEAGARRRTIEVWQGGTSESQDDWIADEVPVALVYNGVSHVVMMASPVALKEFAYGFSFTEGIIGRAADVYDLALRDHESGIEVDLQVSSRVFAALQKRRRNLTGRTGCGLCGVESLEEVHRVLQPVAPARFRHRAVETAVRGLSGYQRLQAATGAVHGAAWCNPEGEIQGVFEDVGRHNALDKLVGFRLLHDRTEPGFALVSSRASYEMVQKSIVAGFPMLVSLSAATDLAVELAARHRMTLVGFARSGRHVVYTGADLVF